MEEREKKEYCISGFFNSRPHKTISNQMRKAIYTQKDEIYQEKLSGTIIKLKKVNSEEMPNISSSKNIGRKADQEVIEI